MAKSKKKKSAASNKTSPAKKKLSAKKLAAIIIAAVLVVALIVFIVIISVRDHAAHALRDTYWISQSAKNASGDEVDIREVYNVKYSNYQGYLTFDGENGFELWLSPGDSNDGTHTGKYELSDTKLTATFDEGSVVDFPVTRKDGKITSITVPYDDYTVYFYPK